VTAPLLLCTDLDRTLLPNGPQPESPHAREMFARLVEDAGVTLAFVSGRDRTLIEEAIRDYGLPRPDFAISDVGSNIYDLRGGDWQPWSGWHARIAPDWGGCDRAGLAKLLADLDALRPQEAARQSTFKLSYTVPLDVDRQAMDARVEARLRAHGVSAERVWSVDESASMGLLDVVPSGATKAHAVDFLRVELGVPLEHVVYAGDSGNDLQVLAGPIPSVLVANAAADVVRDASARATEAGHREALHLARGGVFGMNGNYAAGILEGVAHFRPDLVPLLRDLFDDLSSDHLA
jgi:hypothetical protein